MSDVFSRAGIAAGDTVNLVTDKEEYVCAEILSIDTHGTVSLKHRVSKDPNRGKAPWNGGDVTDTVDHVKVVDVLSVSKMCER